MHVHSRRKPAQFAMLREKAGKFEQNRQSHPQRSLSTSLRQSPQLFLYGKLHKLEINPVLNTEF
jgi:hypothetical protein